MKTYNFAALIRSAARRIWMWSPMRREAIANARVAGVRPFHVTCAHCGLKMRESEKPPRFRVDHIIPASEPAALIPSFDDFFKRLNVPAKGLQILCIDCHFLKTKAENNVRKRRRKKPKEIKGRR